MSALLTRLREACASVAERARHVSIDRDAIAAYAAGLRLEPPDTEPQPSGTRDALAAFWLTLDSINFGSGWFPTLRKKGGGTGYSTVAAGLKRRFDERGPWSAAELAELGTEEVASTLGQDPQHELMALFTGSLNDLGRHVSAEHHGRFDAVVDAAGDSAESLVEVLASWDCFADTSRYDGLELPFLKRAQIAAADLHRAGAATFADLGRLTMFADNLVPHVLRLDGILRFDGPLVSRIQCEELIEHGAPEEVEIRACAVHAVELLVAERPDATATAVDQLLWLRGQEPRYKAVPRHRSRCTAY